MIASGSHGTSTPMGAQQTTSASQVVENGPLLHCSSGPICCLSLSRSQNIMILIHYSTKGYMEYADVGWAYTMSTLLLEVIESIPSLRATSLNWAFE